eukprot:g2895.t1
MTKLLTQTDLQSLIPCEAVSNKEDNTSSMKKKESELWWEQTTNDLVHLSTFPFLVLSLPQLIRNSSNLQKGNLAALAVLSWKGFMTALAGNSILLSYFLTKKERGAALVQAIGVISNFTLLFQIYISGLLNNVVFWMTFTFICISAFVNGTILSGILNSEDWSIVNVIGRLWETFLSVLGLSLFVQVLWSTIFPKTTLLPAMITAILSVAFDTLTWSGKLSPALKEAWSGVSAWTATFLFAFQPIGQLACNFADPSSLTGLSLGTILLAMCGNGLMVPRALYTRDKIWLTGTLWSSLMMGWAQLLCLYLAGLKTGLDYLSPSLFYFFSAFQAFYFIFVFVTDARVSNLDHPLASIMKTYFPR